MEREIIRAIALPSDPPHIAAVGRFVLAIEEVKPGQESQALANLAAQEMGSCELRCEPALADAGRASGWIVEEDPPNLEENRAALCFMLLIGDGEHLYTIDMVEKVAEIAADYLAYKPWEDLRVIRGAKLFARTQVKDPNTPRAKPTQEEFMAVVSPPLGDGETNVTFMREGAPWLFVGFSPEKPIAIVEKWLADRGVVGYVPVLGLEETAEEPPRAFDDRELVTALALLHAVATRASVGLGFGSVMVYADWARPKRGAKRVGRNEKCPCGSGKKYKKCHELSDAILELVDNPGVLARPGAGGTTELIVATDGKPVPEGGYDDCPICQAELAAARRPGEALN